ncbi:anti-sigma factor [Nocardioides sp. Soil796]|uniref:anti-sigma factor n=1 Tax=Nocardioides sp. Soil796 TaxID=1736412 RepID=UPI00070DF1C8|nr:anti-sigma factor [Nocardioides sp. Soil796]KRF15055.1 hypothetical protein ASH02_12495 [Nocardioides sp. Soil796]
MSDIHALSGAYAVDALDDIERHLFEKHLATCADCRAEVAGLQETAAVLAAAVATPPPPALKDRIMAEVATVRPLPPEVPGRHVDEERPSRRRWFPSLVAAAAAVAVIGGGAVVITQPWQDETTQLSATAQVTQASDAATISADLPDGSTARIVRSASRGQAVLLADDMPEAPAGKVYQLWLQAPSGDMLPAGLMNGGDAEVLLDGDARTATGAGITVEPAGGSPTPTSDPVALFAFEGA